MNLAHIIAKEVYSVLHERDTQPEIIDKLLKPHAKKILAAVNQMAGGTPGSENDKLLHALMKRQLTEEEDPLLSQWRSGPGSELPPEGSRGAARARAGVGAITAGIPAGDELAAAYFAAIDKDKSTKMPLDLKLKVLTAALYVASPVDASVMWEWIAPIFTWIDDYGLSRFVLHSLQKQGFPKDAHFQDWENWKLSLKSKIGQREKPAEEELEEMKIKENKCKLIVGKIVSLHIDKKLLEKDGFLSLNKGEIPTIGGCDGYYIPKDYVRKEYQKPNKK